MGTLLVVLAAVLGLCRADSDLKCDNTTLHEVPDCRFPCPPERTCQNFRGPEPPCVPPTQPCTPQCVCADGYARNKYGGTCVTLAQCDQCPGNNQYFSCDGPYSENCTGSCHCNTGYARDANNVCVSTSPPPVDTHPSPPSPVLPSPPVEGPQPVTSEPQYSDLKCDNASHEVPVCRDPCPPLRTCQTLHEPEPPCLPSMQPCTPQCACAAGYVRNKYGGMCVTRAQCDQCPGYNQYFSCDGPYSENCTESCHCTTGYARDANNVCVSTAVITCDNVTKHEIAACVYGCPPERTCQNRNWPPLPCAPPAFPCSQKCICDEGYARNQPEGTCITLEQCDQCGENEYFQCDGDYHENCVGRCYCLSWYTRDKDGKCVYPTSTPKDNGPTTPEPEDKCPGINQYFACDGSYSENCNGSCHCADGYERDANNICVSTTPSPPPRVYYPPTHPIHPTRPECPLPLVEPVDPDCYKVTPDVAIFYNL